MKIGIYFQQTHLYMNTQQQSKISKRRQGEQSVIMMLLMFGRKKGARVFDCLIKKVVLATVCNSERLITKFS